MSPVSIDDRWSFQGFRVVTLENDKIRLDVIPELGARIFRFIHKASGTDLLWHHPRIQPRAVPIGASYDDHFSGGWDELFPNDAAGPVGDAVYPDHGELWCQPWDYRIEEGAGSVSLHLSVGGAASTSFVEKTITLTAGASHARFRHRIRNVGPRRLDFLWKLHPALAIEPGDRIDVPGKTGELVDPAFGRIAEPRTFPWPVAKSATRGEVDFSRIPDTDSERDFLYVRDLADGWCALRRSRLGIGFGLAFAKDVFTSVWLFMTYGGWRGLHTLVLEPCTAYPKDLATAIKSGQCARLEPGAVLETEVTAVVFEGTQPVRRISLDGAVTH